MTSIWFAVLICATGADDPTTVCSATIVLTPHTRGWSTEAECFDSMKTWDVANNQKRACWKFDVEETP